jgi:hypothetical protein
MPPRRRFTAASAPVVVAIHTVKSHRRACSSA